MSIKELAEDDRPREKFLLKGRSALSDSELLAIILKIGNSEQTAVELAREILASVDNNWHQLSRLSLQDLTKFRGVGRVKAIEILAVLEIGRRRAQQEVPSRPVINSSQTAFSVLHPHLADLPVEEFWVILLNNSNQVVKLEKLSGGGITFSSVDLRVLFKLALEHYATGIIIAHNHPSGKLQESEADRRITKEIAAAGKILNIALLDHIIVCQNRYLSFADMGIL